MKYKQIEYIYIYILWIYYLLRTKIKIKPIKPIARVAYKSPQFEVRITHILEL